MRDAAVFRAPRPLGLPDGERLFAIGDIHGRLDLFTALMKAIVEDLPPSRGVSRVVVLGDVIDRGPSSRALVERFMRYTRATDRFVVLKGNHEQMMVRALKGDVAAFRRWLEYGGEETLQSWGVRADAGAAPSAFALIKQAREAIGEEVLSWMDALPTIFRSGDVLCVHAGVRPEVALEAQVEEDLLWIRRDFLDSATDHGALIVHGHTITPEGPLLLPNRIAVDTGAYQTGVLSAVGFEAETVQVLRT